MRLTNKNGLLELYSVVQPPQAKAGKERDRMLAYCGEGTVLALNCKAYTQKLNQSTVKLCNALLLSTLSSLHIAALHAVLLVTPCTI